MNYLDVEVLGMKKKNHMWCAGWYTTKPSFWRVWISSNILNKSANLLHKLDTKLKIFNKLYTIQIKFAYVSLIVFTYYVLNIFLYNFLTQFCTTKPENFIWR